MRFQKTFYPYQQEILSIFENEREKGEKKIHIVAPPGSGKTILGCEMLCRIGAPTLILVPNLTLLSQWKDKLETLFLEEHESSDQILSTNINEIKYINILTYQSITGTDSEDDDIKNEIYNIWYVSERNDFASKELFFEFLKELRELNPNEYQEEYDKQRKKLKNLGESNTTRKMMKEKIFEYTNRLKNFGVKTMIVDEAHHLTSWWSHVLFEIYKDLSEPYIIGLTATPPFDDVDYFELDESYTNLLGTVDYIVPTPAIVRSGRLAPYSDLLYIVSPGEELKKILNEREGILGKFIEKHNGEIVHFLHNYLTENYEKIKTKSGDMCDKWMRFIYKYKGGDIDMSGYIHGGISDRLSLEDIAKSIGKWASNGFKKSKSSSLLDEVKTLFFELGYIWRGTNLYRFETPIEKGLIYAKSKQEGIREILKKEGQNLGANLKCAIITDFLDADSDWINCHSIFDGISSEYGHLHPYIVSGQGIWKLEGGKKVLDTNETILTVTEKLQKGEIKLVIGTRGILGEGWDCPELNTLIDLTGVSAYMSVNQVHGRAIRLDQNNSEKVANIYDIVCIGDGYQGQRDFERIVKKHAQFYGVDDAGLIIKGLDHIYPQLEKNIENKDKINTYTLKKSELRGMVKELWNIGKEFKNEEIFSLALEINNTDGPLYLPASLGTDDLLDLARETGTPVNILEFGKTKYHEIARKGIRELIDASLQVMKPLDLLPKDFTYSLKWSTNGSMTVVSDYHDPLISKKFIEIIHQIFDAITEQKYLFKAKNNLQESRVTFQIGSFLITAILGLFPVYIFIGPFALLLYFIIVTSIVSIGKAYEIIKNDKILGLKGLKEKFFEQNDTVFGLPSIITSNEEKRDYFTGKKHPSLPTTANWYNRISKYLRPGKLLIAIFGWSAFTLVLTAIQSILIVKVSVFILEFLIFLLFLMGCIVGIHYFYYFYARIYNYRKGLLTTKPAGEVQIVSQSDIGRSSNYSTKIEKIWI